MNGYDESRYYAHMGEEITESPMMKRIFATPTYTEEESEWVKWFMGEEKPVEKEQKKSA